MSHRLRKAGTGETNIEDILLNVVVLGASGDLAKKKTYPALFKLFQKDMLPQNVNIIGYARSKLSDEDLREKVREHLKDDEQSVVEKFLSLMTYTAGAYDDAEGFKKLNSVLKKNEAENSSAPAGRLFYLALPPSVYPQVCKGIKENCAELPDREGSWLRVVVEKPFGKDLDSSEALADELGQLFPEKSLYRIDHYLGKELMQNMLVLRFANAFLGPIWNHQYISNVQITFKEPFGTEGRGGYFDEFGIIRDVMQNHLIQILALVAMEKPVSNSADDIRDEKVKVLRCLQVVGKDDVIIGQHTAANGIPGYLDDEGVPVDSNTPTFAAMVLHIENDRWSGVPFVVKAGKALNERKTEIRVQFKPPNSPFHGDAQDLRNELVIRVQPDEAVYMKMAMKKPGLDMDTIMTELDLTYKQRYSESYIPDAYERLILDAITGDQQHFVRRDELKAAWKAFTPILHAIDNGEVMVDRYPAGSRGPPAADAMISKAGFRKNKGYKWPSGSDIRNSLDIRR